MNPEQWQKEMNKLSSQLAKSEKEIASLLDKLHEARVWRSELNRQQDMLISLRTKECLENTNGKA